MNKNYKGYKVERKIKKDAKRQNNSLLYVSVRDNNIERALREFKKRVKNSGLLKELKERGYYEKKSLKKRRLRKLRALKIKTLQKD